MLSLPNWAYLGFFFVIPLISVLALSVSRGNPEIGYSYTWPLHWGEFSDAISTYHVAARAVVLVRHRLDVITLVDRLPGGVLDRVLRRT